MKYRLRLAGLVLAAFVTGCTPTQTPTSETKTARMFDPLVDVWPHDLSDIPVDANVTYGRLDNGLRYALQTNARPENEAVVRFWIRAGSRNETDQTLGLAHFLEHMAFNGSENVPEGEMVRSLERLGLSFGADTNASTTFTRTEYQLNLPEVDDETVDYALFLMRETADRLIIDPEAVDRERGVVKSEEARSNTPGRKASRAYQAFAYPDTLSLKRPVIGLPETLDSITAEQLREFYDKHYRPERSLLVITGDFDLAEIEQKIIDVFGDWTNETIALPDPDNGRVKNQGLKAQSYDDDELTTQVGMMSASNPTDVMDSQAARRDGFIRGYANGIVNQRIRKRLLSSGATVLGASISYSSRERGDQASASASAKDDDWQAGIDLLVTEINRALEYGFQQAEYDELLANSRRSYTDTANYAAKRRSGSLASGIVGAFANDAVRTTPAYSLEAFERHAKSVSLQDLDVAFKEMWSDFTPIIWVQGPSMEDVTHDDILSAYTDAQAQKVTPPEQRKALTFAYQDFGVPGKVKSQSRVEDFDIDQILFQNNVRLNMKKTDFEDKWVNISVTVGEGWNAFPEELPGLTSLAGAIALGGYEAHKASELSEIFAGKNVGLNMSVGSERLVFRGSTNPDDVEDQFKAWTALLTNPGYRSEWLEKYQENIASSFHTIDSTPGGVASRDLGRIWASGDKRFGMLSKEEYLAMSLEDVRKTLDPVFKKGAIEIGVVGDFDKQAVINAVAKTYGALPGRNENFNLNLDSFKLKFPQTERVALTHTGAENQGAIYLAWPTQKNWTIERSRQYGIIRRILQNRMTEIIREDLSLAYSPSASLRFDRNYDGYGYVSASMSSDPQYFEAFETAALEIAADLRQSSITQDELDRARKPVLESYQRSERENSAWLSNVVRSQTDPSGLDYRRSRIGYIEGLTPEILNKAAKELFTPESLHIVTISPENRK